MELWDSDIEIEIIRPIGRKAIDLYGDEIIKNGKRGSENYKNVEIDGYKVKLIRNLCIEDDLHSWLFPLTAGMSFQVNIEIGLPKNNETRWFVGIYYKKSKDGEWIDESNLELTTMATK